MIVKFECYSNESLLEDSKKTFCVNLDKLYAIELDVLGDCERISLYVSDVENLVFCKKGVYNNIISRLRCKNGFKPIDL